MVITERLLSGIIDMNFAVFICTHGRPDKQHTLDTLRRTGYTGNIYLVVDDEDDTIVSLDRYVDGVTQVVQFCKQGYINSMDTGTIENQRKCILYAKGACEDLAKHMKLDAFVIADDDIKKFRYRYVEDGHLKSQNITKNMDAVIEAYTNCMVECNLTATGFGFTQFYFSGKDSFSADNTQKYRVPYNFVFRNPKYKVNWMSWFGEDIITAVYYGRIGQMWTAIPYVQQDIVELASADGGMKDVYDSNSSVRLAMQNVMYLPSELCAFFYRDKFMASINKDKAFPKLISSKFQLQPN